MTAWNERCGGGTAAAASSAAPSSRTCNRSRCHQPRQGQANGPRAATTIALAVQLLLIVLALLAVAHHASAAATSNAKNNAPASEMPSERPKVWPVAAAGGTAAFNAKQKDKTSTTEVRAEGPNGRARRRRCPSEDYGRSDGQGKNRFVNQQKQVGYAHLDVHPDNIRITPQEQLPGKREQMIVSAAQSLLMLSQRSRRGHHRRQTSTQQLARRLLDAVYFAVTLLLVLNALVAVGVHGAKTKKGTSYAASSSRRLEGPVETVGGVTVQVGEKIKVQTNTRADVQKASTDGKTDNAIYKENRRGAPLGQHEVAATRAANQLISAEGNRMIQHKVGEMGLNDYLKQASKDPAAKKAYQRTGLNPLTKVGRPKLSDHINDQVQAQQRRVGCLRLMLREKNSQYKGPKAELVDWGSAEPRSNPDINLKHEAKLDRKEIKNACAKHGFRFRSGGGNAAGALYRRTPGSCSINAPSSTKKVPPLCLNRSDFLSNNTSPRPPFAHKNCAAARPKGKK
ncbi:hypothetical protein DFJ73DRAFT_763346 [Zopfochytrium polystomum]|nr:hypothetical protein DFJ73DRAFT_763346 [Zopfochytrium polystomum]